MKGHFKRNKLSPALRARGFDENITYECFYNGSNQLVVHHPEGPFAIINKPLVESGPSAMPTMIFKITSVE